MEQVPTFALGFATTLQLQSDVCTSSSGSSIIKDAVTSLQSGEENLFQSSEMEQLGHVTAAAVSESKNETATIQAVCHPLDDQQSSYILTVKYIVWYQSSMTEGSMVYSNIIKLYLCFLSDK